MTAKSAPFWTRVNKTETCWYWTGGTVRGGYGHAGYQGKTQVAHRVAYQMLVGPIEPGMVLDHTCHNRLCVNPDHLRQVTHKQNLENLSGAYSCNKSGVRGVTWHKASKKWPAQVTHNQKLHHLGYFDNIPEAESAVVAKRLELFTHNDLDRRNESL